VILVRETDFPEIRDGWLELERDGHLPTVFQTYDWMETWWKHLGFRGRKLILAAYDGEELIGIAPLYISKLVVKGVPLFNVARLIGAGESDYQAFILRTGKEELALRALLEHLRRYKWDIFWFSDVHPETATNHLIADLLRTARYHCVQQRHTPCPYISLPGTIDEYKQTLSRNSRRNLTKVCNRVERLEGMKYVKIAEVKHLDGAMDNFFNLHQNRWVREGQKGALAEEKVRNFHLEAAARLFRYLDLRQLILKDRVIATTYSYDFNTKRGVYLPGMDMDFEHYSLGSVMMEFGIRDAIERGLREFDFMRGDEEYKFHFTKTVRHNMRYFFAKNFLKFKTFCKLEGIS